MHSAKDVWIKNPRFDLSFIFGGALFTLLVPLAASLSPVLLVPLFFWGWLFFFEGSHFWATYSRTYMDAKFRGENQGVLTASLVFLALPAAAVVLSTTLHDPIFMNGYGFFIFSWSLYHNTRQHYGFVSLYNRKVGADEGTMRRFRWGTYLATFGPMAHFFLSYKLKGEFPGVHGALADFLFSLPAVFSIVGLGYLGYLTLRHQSRNEGSPIALFYLLTCLVFYNAMFFIVAAREPFLPSPQNFAQTLMIISVMNSLFHNIQYHAIVWHYSQKRYAAENGSEAFGWARINAKLPTYALAALAFSTFFALVFWWRGEIPFLTGAVATNGLGAIAYIVYFGIVGHHFFLDQKIWRPSRSTELARYFAVGTAARAA